MKSGINACEVPHNKHSYVDEISKSGVFRVLDEFEVAEGALPPHVLASLDDAHFKTTSYKQIWYFRSTLQHATLR